MRIIGSIDHPAYKITVFKMDNRVTLKIENERYEQTYKLGDADRYSTLEGVRTLVTDGFLGRAAAVFQEMHRNRMEAEASGFPQDTLPPFPVII
jgi:hypothetical protein